MPSNDEEFSNSPGFLKYKIEQIEKLVYPLIDTVNSLDKKVSLLAQKIVIATVLIGSAFQVFGLWYSNRNDTSYTETEKKMYYDMRVQESDTIEALRGEIERLKKENR